MEEVSEMPRFRLTPVIKEESSEELYVLEERKKFLWFHYWTEVLYHKSTVVISGEKEKLLEVVSHLHSTIYLSDKK